MIRSLSSISRLSIIGLGAALAPHGAMAFDSGSTGADGAFNPTATTEVQLPPNGIFNFTTVNIPSGVAVTFRRNATNTPVVILASGNITIAGTLSVSGSPSAHSGASGDGNIADDGLPGVGGPGGYDGGRGGSIGANYPAGGSGLGPGGGTGGYNSTYRMGGGGGFRTAGGTYSGTAPGGPSYGAETLLPLIGGSGGGGGTGGTNFRGTGGGGGGGALLIASSGTVSVTGGIYANGGGAGAASGLGAGLTGGGGSGGAIRIVATTISGGGSLYAVGGSAIAAGGSGWIRLEAENMLRSSGVTNPANTFGAPGTVFVPGLPTLAITSVAGAPAPAAPTGNADITLPADTTNPVTVIFATTGVPLDSVVKLTVAPAAGTNITATSGPLTGTEESATASVSVSLPSGASALIATTSYTVTTALGDSLSMFAKGERVKAIELSASAGMASTVTLVTVTGKKYTLASSVAASYIPG